MIILKYNNDINNELLHLWVNHYIKTKIPFHIYCNKKNIKNFKLHYPIYITFLTTSLNDNYLELSVYDFLFNYTTDENDNMILNYVINKDDLYNNIGRVFFVPILNKPKYCTFEIPDFIIYQHHMHSHFTKYGINRNNKPSNNIVCLCLLISPIKNIIFYEYYENDILFNNTIQQNIYIKHAYNIYVNKEKQYGIIWHPKCGCSTASIYFHYANNLPLNNIYLLANNNKFKYNCYLENINLISIVRNPYFRFISCYFNKHVDKRDNIYLNMKSYINYINTNDDTIHNFINYTLNNFIDEHTIPINKMYYNIYNLKSSIIKIEDNLNDSLFAFFKQYHDIININLYYNTTKTNNNIFNPSFLHYSVNDWLNYFNIYKSYPNYELFINGDLKNKLDKIYDIDFFLFKYDKYIPNNISNISNNEKRQYNEKEKDNEIYNYVNIINNNIHHIIYKKENNKINKISENIFPNKPNYSLSQFLLNIS